MLLAAQLLLLASSAAADQSATLLPTNYQVFCGGETDAATVEKYFTDLRKALAATGSNSRFNKFVDERFGIRSKRGRTLYFRLRDVGAVTPGRISLAEWREISRRGARSLQDAGWRGCFFDNGKVSFAGSGNNGFKLKYLAKDMPWTTAKKGDVVP